ncbi:DUF4190 domain-containing protein [Amycolatopsis sp. cmx-4-68]|uniref:DUF4190 domain-containing protein n=1 Tax=Amycolatopsis sp. cmx-4-68 TaxID=2790938 RepID=UPI00397C6807
MTYPQDPNNPYGRQPPPSGGYQQPGYGQQYPSGGYPQPGYPPQYPGYPGGMQRPMEGPGLAIGALVCSILGIVLCFVVTIAGIVMGHIAYGKAKRGEAEGQGIAMAAFIVGYAGIALSVALGIALFSAGFFR